MRINTKQFSNIDVRTESGQELGFLDSCDLDIHTHTVLGYRVIGTSFIKRLLKIEEDFLIHPYNVVVFNEKELVVRDAFLKEVIQNESLQKNRVTTLVEPDRPC